MNLLNHKQKILFNKALEFHNKGKFQKAIILYSKLIKRVNNNFDLLFLIGTAYIQLGKTSNGIEYLKKSLILKPDNVSAHINLGNGFNSLKLFNEAIASYDKAIEIKPDYADAYNNRGIALKEMRRFNDAIASYDKAIKIKPDHYFAHNNKGVALKEIKFFKEAIESYNKAIGIKSNYIEAINNRGNAFKNLKLYDKALSDYLRVMQLNSNYDYILGKVLHLKMFLCDWKDFDTLSEQINKTINEGLKATEPFPYLSIADRPSSSKLVSEIFVKDKFFKASEIQNPIKYFHKKPKIAYFSGDFHNHPILHLMMEVFKNHDRSNFDFFAFSFGPDKNDKWRNEVKNYFFQFKDISKISDKEVLNYVKDLEIDIAIDLTGFTSNARSEIFTNRIAQTQINWGFLEQLG